MKTLTTILLLAVGTLSIAQQKETYPVTQEALQEKIITLDTQAFEAYNTCDLEKFKTFFTDDLEFYHDKGGFTKGIEKFIEAMRNNICNNPQRKILRKPAEGTFRVYALEGYGAILTGDHDFYIVENGVEKKTGTAKFTHVWLLTDYGWKMARVLSYDHRAVQ
jgi:ketosteroid isomerase-like protein